MPQLLLRPFELRRLLFIPLLLNVDNPLLTMSEDLFPVGQLR
jgi:hypothetical protein